MEYHCTRAISVNLFLNNKKNGYFMDLYLTLYLLDTNNLFFYFLSISVSQGPRLTVQIFPLTNESIYFVKAQT